MSTTKIKVSLSKNIVIRYVCEVCKKTSFSLAIIQKEGVATHPGMVVRESIKKEMKSSAVKSGNHKIAVAESDIKAGVENALRHNTIIDPLCLHCKAPQSWIKLMHRVVSIKAIVIKVCIALFILPFITVWIVPNDAFLYIELALLALSICFYIFLPIISRLRLEKRFLGMSEGDRPSVVTDIDELSGAGIQNSNGITNVDA